MKKFSSNGEIEKSNSTYYTILKKEMPKEANKIWESRRLTGAIQFDKKSTKAILDYKPNRFKFNNVNEPV